MQPYSREISFDGIINFRDLGGYKAKGSQTVAWRRIFRSGYIHSMTKSDATRIKSEFKLTSVIDLRNNKPLHQNKEKNLLYATKIKYFNVPFPSYQQEELQFDFTHMGEAFIFRIRHVEYSKRIIDALEIVANNENHPLLFHCGVGKDRSGLVAAFVLSVLGVADGDIIADYALSAIHMKTLVSQMLNDPAIPKDIKNLPAYSWEATPEAMVWFLNSLKKEFGSVREYLAKYGAAPSLFERLEKALLI